MTLGDLVLKYWPWPFLPQWPPWHHRHAQWRTPAAHSFARPLATWDTPFQGQPDVAGCYNDRRACRFRKGCQGTPFVFLLGPCGIKCGIWYNVSINYFILEEYRGMTFDFPWGSSYIGSRRASQAKPWNAFCFSMKTLWYRSDNRLLVFLFILFHYIQGYYIWKETNAF